MTKALLTKIYKAPQDRTQRSFLFGPCLMPTLRQQLDDLIDKLTPEMEKSEMRAGFKQMGQRFRPWRMKRAALFLHSLRQSPNATSRNGRRLVWL